MEHAADDVQGGRNPFTNMLLTPPPEVTTNLDTIKLPKPAKHRDNYPPSPSSVVPKLQDTITLHWVTPQQVAAAFKAADLTGVRFQSGKQANTVEIIGTLPDFENAVEIAHKLDVAPPFPHCLLTGVIITQTQRLAVVLLDGKQYNLSEGESIPATGWTVTSITEMSATLTKGNLQHMLRLSGGNPS